MNFGYIRKATECQLIAMKHLKSSACEISRDSDVDIVVCCRVLDQSLTVKICVYPSRHLHCKSLPVHLRSPKNKRNVSHNAQSCFTKVFYQKHSFIAQITASAKRDFLDAENNTQINLLASSFFDSPVNHDPEQLYSLKIRENEHNIRDPMEYDND